ncbi:MAG: cysteine peptidase family C39 domain-containing protein [Elusimicrobiota bacterium]
MNIKKIGVIVILILILFFIFGGIFITHQFIEHPVYWKKAITFFKGAKYLGEDGVILQKKGRDCGPASLKMIFDYFNIPITLEKISKKVPGQKSSSMLSLKEMAELKGLKVEGWRLSFKDSKNIKFPAIAFINRNHFVVISKVSSNGEIIVLDPSIGKLKYSSRRFQKIWKGEILIFTKQRHNLY